MSSVLVSTTRYTEGFSPICRTVRTQTCIVFPRSFLVLRTIKATSLVTLTICTTLPSSYGLTDDHYECGCSCIDCTITTTTLPPTSLPQVPLQLILIDPIGSWPLDNHRHCFCNTDTDPPWPFSAGSSIRSSFAIHIATRSNHN